MRVLSLFSGGGLGDLGLMAAGMDIAGQVEIDDYCQKVLALRYPDSVKWKDIREVKGEEVKARCGSIDVVAGGFPCQPFSVAGNQRGDKDDRHLWPQMLRVISEVRPSWVIGENVPGFIDMALDDVLTDLEGIGYECVTFVFPAHALGAWHRRERVWIVAYSKHRGFSLRRGVAAVGASRKGQEGIRSNESSSGSEQEGKVLANSKDANRGRSNEEKHFWGRNKKIGGCGVSRDWRKYWEVEPNVGRVANGVAARVHRLKCLGNGQVPACTAFIGAKIMELENAK